jgi:hypothetical protein
MPRTVVYDSAIEQAHLADVLAEEGADRPTRVARRKAAKRAAATGGADGIKAGHGTRAAGDSYLAR